MQIQTDQDKKELKHHGDYTFPVLISEEQLSNYDNGSFGWHWHQEIELTLILEGEILYTVNENTYHLRPGEGLFVNSNALHTGTGRATPDCSYISFTFHPRVIYGYDDSLIQDKYVTAVIQNTKFPSLLLSPAVVWQREMLERLKRLYGLYLEKPPLYELKVQMLLQEIWVLMLEAKPEMTAGKEGDSRDSMEKIKVILTYVAEHYTEKITLEDISQAIHLCKSECCRYFKKYMKQSLFEYILKYRVEQSIPLLKRGDLSVTEIASRVGFSDSSYYSKTFHRYMLCSPLQYRKKAAV